MIQHVWTALCSGSSIDKVTNNISLFNVVEQIQFEGWEGEPADVPCFLELVTLWSRVELDREGRGEARVILQTPEGSTGISKPQAVDLRPYRRLRSRAQIPTIRIVGPGLYTFVVELRQQNQEEWVPVARVPLEVQVQRAVSEGPEVEVQRS